MAKREKSRFMVIITDDQGYHRNVNDPEVTIKVGDLIDCMADTTAGAIKETASAMPDGIEFMVVQVKREGLSYGVDSKRVLKDVTDCISAETQV